jgi:hypothetical protein
MTEVVHIRQRITRHRFSAWRPWSMLGVFLLQLAATLLPSSLSLAQSLDTIIAAYTEVDSNPNNKWFIESPAESQEWCLQCTQENKHALVLPLHAVDLSVTPQQFNQLRTLTVQALPVAIFLHPLKLSPTAASDDPFLN